MIDMNELRIQIFAARRRTKLTQSDMADILNRSKSAISRMEAGDKDISIFEFWLYCEVLGADPIDILVNSDPTYFGGMVAQPLHPEKRGPEAYAE